MRLSESRGLFLPLFAVAGALLPLEAAPQERPSPAVPEPASAGSGKAAAVPAPTGPDKLPPADWGARLAPVPPANLKGGLKGAKDESRSEPPPPLVIPLVQGYDSFGLNIPEYDTAGNLRSLFAIGAVSRVDDRLVEIRESFLETYKEDGSRDFSIELPKAQLDRVTRMLVAKIPVVVRRAEFELRAASLEFNTYTKDGGFGGPVEMVIYSGFGEPADTRAETPERSDVKKDGDGPGAEK